VIKKCLEHGQVAVLLFGDHCAKRLVELFL